MCSRVSGCTFDTDFTNGLCAFVWQEDGDFMTLKGVIVAILPDDGMIMNQMPSTEKRSNQSIHSLLFGQF